MILRRDIRDARIAGVFAGIARYKRWDPTPLRIAGLVALLCMTKVALVTYLIAWAIMPRDDIY